MYHVKTPTGYYYADGRGRYGRFNGNKGEAWVLCLEHAESLCATLSQYAPEAKPIIEENAGVICDVCKTKTAW